MLKSKKILITGGSSGLGKSLAIKLSATNKVFCLGRTHIKQKNIKSVKCNFRNIKSIKNKLKELLNTKKLDYVFLNAGMLGNIKKIDRVKYKEVEEILKVNVFANKEIIDFLIEKNIKTKLIVAISSGAALAPKLGWFLYCSSKAALKFLIESYAIEHKKFKFISISPGLIKTKMQKQICKINEKKIKSVKKFKELNKKNMVPSPNEVADNLINSIKLLKKKSGDYIDIRKK